MISRFSDSSDKVLMRIKDVLLLVVAIIGLLATFGKLYSKPLELESKVASNLESLKKYVPIVEQNAKDLAVVKSQYSEILRRLDIIDNKLSK